ncbi:hypothetical protein [Kistimonas asteriae]|uniref:hypothetical protein n=1 Tax=Kistimonas asteriae TaxID=517724 RepID=UPI001BAD9CE4|nr:hypothetical protein [Kistimonas asteriae]
MSAHFKITQKIARAFCHKLSNTPPPVTKSTSAQRSALRRGAHKVHKRLRSAFSRHQTQSSSAPLVNVPTPSRAQQLRQRVGQLAENTDAAGFRDDFAPDIVANLGGIADDVIGNTFNTFAEDLSFGSMAFPELDWESLFAGESLLQEANVLPIGAYVGDIYDLIINANAARSEPEIFKNPLVQLELELNDSMGFQDSFEASIFRDIQHEGSPYVLSYLKRRQKKDIFGSVVTLTGTAFSTVTQVNVLATIKHGHAEARTLRHIHEFRKIGNQIGTEFPEIKGLCNSIIKIKAAKAANQVFQMISNLIPNTAIGAGLVGGIPSLIANIYVLMYQQELSALSARLHYFAYSYLRGMARTDVTAQQLQKYAFAYELFREFFRKIIRNEHALNLPIKKSSGEPLITLRPAEDLHKFDKYMWEPAGWQVVLDKLTLI